MIEISHLRKSFGTGATPLKDVNAVINKGDVIAVIGPSGTGKSTLLRCINMLDPPTDGKIIIDGEDITDPKCNINKVRQKLGMVFQSFNLYENLTVVENCMIAQVKLLKRSKKEAYEKAMGLLKDVGMDGKALQYPGQLSGGQRQRVAIARTLSTDPEIILFDEPTSALDPLTVGEVEEVISNLSKSGHTMMIVTHGMDFARSVSNRVFYMDQGLIYEDGTPEQIFDNPQNERTRNFIRRLESVEFVLSQKDNNYNEEIGVVYSFLNKHNIDSKRIIDICDAYEEFHNVIINVILGDEGDDRIVKVWVEYYAKEDAITFSLAPNRLLDIAVMTERLNNSIEYKLFSHKTKGYHIENADNSISARLTFDL